jgi:UDP-glucose 4-epimerase
MITGGSGFVGSSLSKKLIDEGHEVLVIDNFYTGRKENLKDLNIEVVELDLSEKSSIPIIDKLLENIDVCYHFAASIGVKLVQEKPKETFRNSTRINDNIFPLFEKHNTKVIFSSTSEVYGETLSESGSSEEDHLEIHPVQKPRGSYACSKLFSEFMLSSYTFPSVIIRFFNIVGPQQVGDYGHVLPKFINQAKNNEPLTVYGEGCQIRSYCDIRDAVEMLNILLDDEHNGEIYNIGNDYNVFSVKSLAENVINVIGSNSKIEYTPLSEAFSEKFEEIYVRFPNTSKINKYYKCKYSLINIITNIKENL